MGFAGLSAFAGGAGVEPLSAVLAAAALALALVWQPEPDLARRLERVWLPVAALLVARALAHVLVIRDDVVIPVVDLLLLLLAAEALRSLDAPNDVRLYALSFALLLAATAYRPGILFLGAFVAYVALATVALTAGHMRRKGVRHGIRNMPFERGLARTTLALSGVILVMSALVFLTFPRVSRGWTGRGEAVATSIAGFSDRVSIGEHGSRIYGNPRIVLRVEFPEGIPDRMLSLHWRGRSYDHFDGVRWTRSRALPPSQAPAQWYRDRWIGSVLQQRIWAAPLDVRAIFAVHPVIGLDPEPGIQPLFDNAGDLFYWGSAAPAYTAFSRTGSPAPDLLRSAQSGYSPQARYFLQLPALDPRVQQLADSLTAGLTNRYDKAVAIQRYLASFTYTLELPATAREATLEHFLFQRRAGHCEYFSTAMVVLLRAAGVESRNVNGFLGGEWSSFGSYLAVTQNQAHSWVEVWFPGFGWVTFDPTPAGAGFGSREASWMWPGRFLFDAIQHRWNKWVLDYNVEAQSGLLQRWKTMVAPNANSSPQEGTTSGMVRLLGLIALVAVLLGGLRWARRGARPSPTPETALYLRLRTLCAGAGLDVSPGITPLALVERVAATQRSAAHPAGRVVDLYLRARYGREALGESEKREMREALAAVGRALGDISSEKATRR
jgi:transglutaminase-like putative cysteine protease